MKHERNVNNQVSELGKIAGLSSEIFPMSLSPETFDQLYHRHKSGGAPEISSQFAPEQNLFLCTAPNPESTYRRIWLIDADDTLWEDNIHYESLIIEITDYAIHMGTRLSRQEIRFLIDEVEHQVIPKYGFGAEGFFVSITTAWATIADSLSSEVQAPLSIFERIVPFLSGVPYEIPPSTKTFLTALSNSPDDGLVIFTQGPIDIQLNKIANSGLASFFHAIAVGLDKKLEMYHRLVERLPFKSNEYIVVGNSLNSEIRPALELGFKAVHYKNPNSWHSVNSSKLDESSYISVNSLTDVFSCLVIG